MIESQAKLICDAGPIIHLDEISCIDLLNDFDKIIIPSTVEIEVATHRPSALKGSSLALRIQDKRNDIREEMSFTYNICDRTEFSLKIP